MLVNRFFMKDRSVLLIADPLIPIPPRTYGGVERIVDFLAEGLADRGWRVTLACHPESTCRVEHLPHPTCEWARSGRTKNSWNLLKHLAFHRYDLIHSFGHYDLTAPLWPLAKKQIQSFQAPPDLNSFFRRTRLIPKKNLWFTTCGYHMVGTFSHIAPTYAIHNGVRIESFDFQEHVDDDAPLVFLGRIEQIKGTHTAIQIAKATNRKLVIAGNRSDRPNVDRYFLEQVAPHLSSQITYIGEVDDVQKNRLLGTSAALLMPIEWDEPFGIVMAEALACGTPVIGYSRGALPEIVVNGSTGACCNSLDEMIEAVRGVAGFSRRSCRQDAETRFSAPVIVDHYISLYEKILSGKAVGSPPPQPLK